MSRRLNIEKQAEKQEIMAAEGETLLRYRTVSAMSAALASLANRQLPTKEARIHIARCVRILKPAIEEYDGERKHIQNDHSVKDSAGGEGDKVQFRDPLGMTKELADLDDMVVAIKLPKRITDAMLPVNSKTHPNNEDGLSAILADLGPLYDIDLDSDD